jgi:signal transduction histidine kinase
VKPGLTAGLIWITLQALFLILFAFVNILRIEDDISLYARNLERLAVSRNSQNYGFMQSLMMVADVPHDGSVASFADFAKSLHLRYPHIASIAWYEITDHDKIQLKPVVQVPNEGPNVIFLSAKLFQALTTHDEQVQAIVDNQTPNRYFLIEHVHNSSKPFSIVIEIDSGEMLKPSLIENCPKVTWTSGDITFFSNISNKNSISTTITSVKRTIDVSIGDLYKTPKETTLKTSINVEKIISLKAIFNFYTFLFSFACSVLLSILSAYALHQRKTTQRLREAERVAQSNIRRLQRENLHEHSSRVYAIGEMAAGIAHELIQPLTSILINSQTGLKLINATSSALNLNNVLSANMKDAQRASEIIKNIQSFVDPKPTDAASVDVNAAIREVATLMEGTLAEHRFKINLDLDAAPLYCEISRIEIEQVAYNLIRNALEAGEHLQIEERFVEVRTSGSDHDVFILVRDRGPGIDVAMLQDLFLPFVTTKASGMGLGLSISRRIIDRAGGAISARNGGDQGAVFEVQLPKTKPGIAPPTDVLQM